MKVKINGSGDILDDRVRIPIESKSVDEEVEIPDKLFGDDKLYLELGVKLSPVQFNSISCTLGCTVPARRDFEGKLALSNLLAEQELAIISEIVEQLKEWLRKEISKEEPNDLQYR